MDILMPTITAVIDKILCKWWGLVVPFTLRLKGVKVARSAQFYGMPVVSLVKGAVIEIGERVILCSNSRFTALGVNHPVVIKALGKDAKIIIDSDTGISGGSICARKSINIGKGCLLGANVTITDTDFHSIKIEYRRYNNKLEDIGVAPVQIADNVFIGTNSTVLKGVSIGAGAVVGASSLLARSVGANEIWAGNPAKIVRKIDASIVD